ncbi:MAG: 4-(cytidine 5'-diphospho)-2-C-methyl-D-erythritol kinase [Planctomycetaceae bacterium]|nr:4-(cytidine 5'-diphospho)-2-C-methyl-D-erythritol kinase [Planctomycetaceae bacterium]
MLFHQAESPAKINLFLEVVRKRPDRFHEIDSVFAEIDLADTIRAVAAGDDGAIVLTCTDPFVPCDNTNLVTKAARAVQREAGVRAGAIILLEKRIPPGSGLGGGSSNAATAIRLLNDVWGCGISPERQAELGAALGSDVPFFFHGGVCSCRGRGEVVTRLGAPQPPLRLGLMLTGIHSDTAAAYRGITLPMPATLRSSGDLVRAIAQNDIAMMNAAAFNRFETTVFKALPPLGEIHEMAEGILHRPVRMSGSGSSLWFFLDEDEKVDERFLDWCARNRIAFREVRTASPSDR